MPDDNDEVSSHPANESPDLPRVRLLWKFSSDQQTNVSLRSTLAKPSFTKDTAKAGTLGTYIHTGRGCTNVSACATAVQHEEPLFMLVKNAKNLSLNAYLS